jgi:hypothetical protein
MRIPVISRPQELNGFMQLDDFRLEAVACPE